MMSVPALRHQHGPYVTRWLLCWSSKFSSFQNGRFGSFDQGKQVGRGQEHDNNSQQEIKGYEFNQICNILHKDTWGSDVEEALERINSKSHLGFVVDVLKRQKNVDMALNYFRWVQKQNCNQHSQEAYDALLIFLANSKHYDNLQEIFEEMSIARFEPKNVTCVKLKLMNQTWHLQCLKKCRR